MRILQVLAALLFSVYLVSSAHAATIDYVAANISPSAKYDGQSGNFHVYGGDTIEFDLTFSIKTVGGTTQYPQTVTFGVLNSNPPDPFPPVVSGVPVQREFTSATSSFTEHISITAPSMPGAYHVKIGAISGAGTAHGLQGGSGIVIHLVVLDACAPANTVLSLTLDNPCLLYRTASTTFSATLTTSDGYAVSGKSVDFEIDGQSIGSALTDTTGIARVTYNPSALAVGDHTVLASFQGAACSYNASNSSATLGIKYMFLGFQQPINGDGTSQFGGRSIPVKIRIADANGAPVADADAHVFFTFLTSVVLGTDTEQPAASNSDVGNTMRYDIPADQYIFNWDTVSLDNGTYTIRVGLGEGTCADAHTAIVTLKKNGKK